MSEPITVGEALEIAMECFRAGEYETVRGVCEEILRAEPANVNALHLRALSHANCDDPERAIIDLKHALLIRPKDFELLNNLGNIYKGTGESKRAKECYEAALEQEPLCHPAWFNLGNVLVDLGELEEAKNVYNRVHEMAPDFAEAYYNHGLILRREGKTADALAQFKKCITRDTNHVDAQIEIGHCLGALGRIDEALNAYKVAGVVDPQSRDKYAGVMHLMSGDLEQAAECFSNEIAARPQDPFAYRNLGRALVQAGSFDDAIMVYRTALQLQPTAVELQLELGAAYAKGGYTKQAVEYFEHAAQLMPSSWIPLLGRAIALLPDADAFEEAEAKLALSSPEQINDAVAALSLMQPDNLRRMEGGHRDLMKRWGAIVSQVMAAKYPQWCEPLSMPLRDSAGRLRVGVVSRKHHDRHNWRTVSGGIVENLNTSKFQVYEYPTRGVSFETLCSHIRGDYLHVLVFPDLDEVAWQMAALRLAPVQCATWARTETTGLPAIDYFLSGELAEPVDGATHYTERLVKLPGMFMYYDPHMDKSAVASEGEVFADPIEVSDVAGVMVAFQLNMPVVSLRGAVAKARRGAALLEQIGAPELIAENKEEYDALVARLKTDADFWRAMSARIAERKHWAFKDHETIAAFEQWMDSLV